MNDQPPRMVKIAELWQRTSAKTGKEYFSGYAGPVMYLLFDGGMKPHPTRPDEEVHVWRLMVQESDPDRRPQRRDQRGQQTQEAMREKADAHTFGTPHDRRARVAELAEAFDRQGADDEMPF